MPPIFPETDESIRSRLIAEMQSRGSTTAEIVAYGAGTVTGHDLDRIARPYGIIRDIVVVSVDLGPTVKVHRYWNETWQAEYAAGPASQHAVDDREKIEVNVPIDLWERLQRAEKELEEVRDLVVTYFPND